MAADSNNRTLVLSVVAVDLVGYSRKSVAEQMSLKDSFNQALLQAISDISVGDRIILDTGDGVAMGFLGDPEDALYVAMFMHDAINRDSAGSPSGGMDGNAIRIGINLGPVKLATGAGGHPNIIGDGINVAERIMTFAEPGQLTASRPFYEVMSRMSDHYATLFQFIGAHTDKQVRVHDVYLVGKSAAAFKHAQRGVVERAAARAELGLTGKYTARVPSPPFSATPAARKTATSTVAEVVVNPAPVPKEAPAPIVKKPEPVAPSPKPKAVEPAPASMAADAPASPNALIDFLEDRNKVATTATMLVIVAVMLAALLVYRKMQIAEPAAVVAAASPSAISKPPVEVAPALPTASNSPAAAVPSAPLTATPAAAPALASTAKTEAAPPSSQTKAATNIASPVVVPAPKVDTKPAPPSPAPANITATSTASPAVPAKSADRLPPVGAGDTSATKSEKPKDTRPEKSEKSDKPASRDEPRKPGSRTGERNAPATAPIVPVYQSPAEAPKPEVVAPTPAPVPPPSPVIDNNVVVVSRTAPPYPKEGIRQAIPSGFVRARIVIDANGNVSDVIILESRPIPAFGRETRSSALQWKYNRGAAGRVHEIEITFKP